MMEGKRTMFKSRHQWPKINHTKNGKKIKQLKTLRKKNKNIKNQIIIIAKIMELKERDHTAKIIRWKQEFWKK